MACKERKNYFCNPSLDKRASSMRSQRPTGQSGRHRHLEPPRYLRPALELFTLQRRPALELTTDG